MHRGRALLCIAAYQTLAVSAGAMTKVIAKIIAMTKVIAKIIAMTKVIAKILPYPPWLWKGWVYPFLLFPSL
jgi:hypothetical protein